MSSLIVEVCEVSDVLPHQNADKLEIVQIKGWRCISQKGQFTKGQKVVYFPPDCVLPGTLSDRLNVTKYLQPLAKDINGVRPDGGRIRVARLRGEKSYGLTIACEQDWPVGTNVAEHYGVTKWEPPEPCEDGDAARPHPSFVHYTDIENFRNFPDVIREGEEVVFTEKLHGMNARVGIIKVINFENTSGWIYMAGSHGVRRKEVCKREKSVKDPVTKEIIGKEMIEVRSKFWDCLTDKVKDLLSFLSEHKDRDWIEIKDVIVFGEMIGQGIQDMYYGTKFDFRVFDIMIEGKYVDFDEKMDYLTSFNIPHVPVLYRGPFSKEKMEEFVDGPTTMCAKEMAGKFGGREGIVITPVKERFDANLGGDGRVILKAISFAYLERHSATEYH